MKKRWKGLVALWLLAVLLCQSVSVGAEWTKPVYVYLGEKSITAGETSFGLDELQTNVVSGSSITINPELKSSLVENWTVWGAGDDGSISGNVKVNNNTDTIAVGNEIETISNLVMFRDTDKFILVPTYAYASAENVTGEYGENSSYSISVDFKNASNASISIPSNAVITYSEDGRTYSENELSYSEVGNHTVFYKVEQSGLAVATGSAIVTITRPISDATITLSMGNQVTYTSNQITQEISVTMDGVELVNNIDYTISGVTSATDINAEGTMYKITITGKGNYTGTKDVFWSIIPDTSNNPSGGDGTGDNDDNGTGGNNTNQNPYIPYIPTQTPTDDTSSDNTDTNPEDSATTLDTSYAFTCFRVIRAGKDFLEMEWNELAGIDGIEVYGTQCNTKDERHEFELVHEITGDDTTSWIDDGLDMGTYYKYYLKAYKLVGGEKQYVAKSRPIHATTTGGKYGNAHKVVAEEEVTLKLGETYTLDAEYTIKTKKVKEHTCIKFESSDVTVATVETRTGVITPVGKGTCTIYVYAQNGKYTTVTVTVEE